jgi:hypothetical protein
MEQPPNACVYSSRMVKNYRICPIRIEIIHDRHRVVQIYTWAGVKFEYKGPAHVYICTTLCLPWIIS